MREITVIVDEMTGALSLEGLDWDEAQELLGDDLGEPTSFNCAMPLPEQVVEMNQPDQTIPETNLSVRVHRIYAGAVAEGPGRRVVIQVQGCAFACEGCFVPETHSFTGGHLTTISRIVEQIIACMPGHDGVTILGGEPFAQEEALLSLLEAFKEHDIHTCVYTGWTIEKLLVRARRRPGGTIDRILRLIDVLIDGRYVQALSKGAGEWKGSTNQRIIEHPAMWVA